MELKPCPFCGGKAYMAQNYLGQKYVRCPDCGACVWGKDTDDWRISVMGEKKAEKAAIEAWNRRAKDDIPAADVRPVVRGEWIQDCDYHFRCSVCGDRWTVSNGNPLDVANGWNYCPNCGADMKGENND